MKSQKSNKKQFQIMRPLKLSEVEHLLTDRVNKSTDGFLGPYELMVLGVPSTGIELMFVLGMLPFDVRNATANEIGPLGDYAPLLARLNFRDGRPTNIVYGAGSYNTDVTWTEGGKRASQTRVRNADMVSEVTIPFADDKSLAKLPSPTVKIVSVDKTVNATTTMMKYGFLLPNQGYDGDIYFNYSKTVVEYAPQGTEDGVDIKVPEPTVTYGGSISYHTNRTLVAPNGDVLKTQIATPFPVVQTEHGLISLTVPTDPDAVKHTMDITIDGELHNIKWSDNATNPAGFVDTGSNGYFEPDSSFPGLVRHAGLNVSGNLKSEVIIDFRGKRIARFQPEFFRTPWGNDHRMAAQQAVEAHRKQVAAFNNVDHAAIAKALKG